MAINNRAFLVECPHCKEAIELTLWADIGMPTSANEPLPKRVKPEPDRMTQAQRQFVDLAISNGMFEAFKTAVTSGSMAQHPPKDMEAFFLLVIRTSKPRIIPKAALYMFLESFPERGTLDFYSGNGIGIVTLDNRIRAFIPAQMVIGEAVRNASRSTKLRLDADEEVLRNWIKTRRGYVPADSKMFLDTLRKKSIGEFANPAI